MSNNEAIILLQSCKKAAEYTMLLPRLRKNEYYFMIRSYVKVIVPEIIRQVQETGEDPFTLVDRLYHKMELRLGESEDDAFITHNFTNHMMQSCLFILEYMKYHK